LSCEHSEEDTFRSYGSEPLLLHAHWAVEVIPAVSDGVDWHEDQGTAVGTHEALAELAVVRTPDPYSMPKDFVLLI
jgi:hypothetical protein